MQVRNKMALKHGTELALEFDDSVLKLTREVPPPKLVRRGKRLMIVPSVAPSTAPSLDIPAMVEEERKRWPL